MLNTLTRASRFALSSCLCFCLFLAAPVAFSPSATAAAHEDAQLLAAVDNTKKVSRKKARAKAPATASKKRGRSQRAASNQPYRGAIVFDMNAGKTLFSQEENVSIPPASLTKILSMYVAHDLMRARKLSPETIVTVSANAANAQPSRMGLHAGDRVSLDTLFRGMAIASGNDASVAVAEFFGGTESNFAMMLNRKARELGMRGSLFKNASGLPAPGQVTTPTDMLTLARSYLRAYPQNLERYHRHSTMEYRGYTKRNANPLLDKYFGADGLKTGYVDASGFNIIATAKRGTKRVIVVLLGSPSSSTRAREIAALMDSGFTSAKDVAPTPAPKRRSYEERTSRYPKREK